MNPFLANCSYRLDLKVQCDQGEHKGLQILNKVVKDTKSFWILGFGDIDERTNLGSLERHISDGL